MARTAERGHRRRAVGWVAALLVVTAATLPWSVQTYWDAKPDAGTYLIAARALARGEGYRVMGEPFTLRPPGFSLLLAPLVAWRGIDFTALNLYVSAFGVAAVVLFFLLLRPRVGAPVAFAGALVVWLQPGFQQITNQVLADVPGLALALACLVLLRRSDRRPSTLTDAALGLAIGAACWVRTANLLLLPAVLLDRVTGRRFADARRRGELALVLRRGLVPVVVAALAYAPWALRPAVAPSYGQEALRSYAAGLLRIDAADPDAGTVGLDDLAARVERNLQRYASAIDVDPRDGRPTPLAWAVLGLGLVGWLVVLVRRREAPEWLAGLTFATLLVYFAVQPRLALVPAVLVLGATAETLRRALGRVLPGRGADALLVAALALVAWATFAHDFMRPSSREKYAEMLAVARLLAASSSADEPLGADNATAFALLLDRPVYGLQPLCNRRGIDAAREAIARWRLERIVVQRDGPCAPLAEGMVEEGSFRHLALLRVRRD